MTLIRTGSDTRPDRRHYRYEAPAPRQQVTYTCPRGHTFEITLAAEAEVPGAWSCRCGATAGTAPDDGDGERGRLRRTVLGRRTRAELEQILAEAAARRKAAHR